MLRLHVNMQISADMLNIAQLFCNFSKRLTNFKFFGVKFIQKHCILYIQITSNLFPAKWNKNKLNRTPEHEFMRLSFPLPLCEKNGQKISENILEYYQKSEVLFKCIFVIRNDLKMIKVTGGLSKIFAQLSRATKFWKNWPNNKWKYSEYHQKSEIVFICIFVIRNDLYMIRISGGLSKMFAQLSGTTKFWKKMAKR